MTHKFLKGDSVMILTGKDKGKISNIIQLSKCKVIIDGLNLAVKSVKPTKKKPQGGQIKKEAFLHISKHVCVNPGSFVRTVSKTPFAIILP